jgi:hypothetical protein
MKTLDLPSKCGPVTMNYSPHVRIPQRDNPLSITLPSPNGRPMLFHLLKGGNQFIVHYANPHRVGMGNPCCNVFGGFDERAAFLTGVTNTAWSAFQSGGEEGFFDALTPSGVRLIRSIYPDAPVFRQGDIWGVGVPQTWSELAYQHLASNRRRRKAMAGAKPSIGAVLDTNHRLSARQYGPAVFSYQQRTLTHATAAAEGTLEAPDHDTRTIDAPHILVRTPNLEPTTTFQRMLGWE